MERPRHGCMPEFSCAVFLFMLIARGCEVAKCTHADTMGKEICLRTEIAANGTSRGRNQSKWPHDCPGLQRRFDTRPSALSEHLCPQVQLLPEAAWPHAIVRRRRRLTSAGCARAATLGAAAWQVARHAARAVSHVHVLCSHLQQCAPPPPTLDLHQPSSTRPVAISTGALSSPSIVMGRALSQYVVVTGGIMSGLGKGITASSIAVLLQGCGWKV